MNSTKTKCFLNLISLASLVFFLSACNVLPKSFLADKQDVQPTDINHYDPNKDMRTTETRLNELERNLSDWTNNRKSVLELVKLEEDLSFMMNQLKPMQFQETPSLADIATMNKFLAPESAGFSSKEGVPSFSAIPQSSEQFPETLSSLDDGVNMEKFSNNEPINQSIELKSATPLSKFQDLPTESAQKFVVDSDKFNGQLVAKDDYSDSCDSNNYEIGTGFAIHLASYANQDTANREIKKFVNKNKNIVCGKTALIKNVVVNEKQFYSLRLGPFKERSEAQFTCNQVMQKQTYCGVTQFDGGIVNL